MKGHCRVLLGRAVVVLVSCGVLAVAQQSASASSNAALDRMIADGKSQREVAQYIFDSRGCNDCHTIGREGKLGFTKKGRDTSQGFEGCISTLKAMTIIARVPEGQRSETQRRRAQRFEQFGCTTCHRASPGKVALTEMGTKLANLHLGCVDVEKVLASTPASPR
jgi:cytochrome c551/c552